MEQEADVNGKSDAGVTYLLAVYNQHREEQRAFRAEFTHTMNWIGAALAALGLAEVHFFSNADGYRWEVHLVAAIAFPLLASLLWWCGVAALGNASWQFAEIAQAMARIHERMGMFEGVRPVLPRKWRKWGHDIEKYGSRGGMGPLSRKCYWTCLRIGFARVPHHAWALTIWALVIIVYCVVQAAN
jgi:hypothetical protein